MFAAFLMVATPVQAAAPGASHPPRAVSSPAAVLPDSPDDRLRALVALIDAARARAAAPGLRDEERDALAELAWAQADEALEDPLLRERAERDRDFLQAYALLQMDDGEDEQALSTLERLRVIAPQDPETHRLQGLCLMGLGRAEEAIGAYRRAFAQGVTAAAEVRAQLAYALAVFGKREEGLAESATAIAAEPAGYLGHFVRGWILGELGRTQEQRREYLEAVHLERDDADLWSLLAESWESAGDHAQALEAWREVLRIDPSDEDAAEKLKKTAPAR